LVAYTDSLESQTRVSKAECGNIDAIRNKIYGVFLLPFLLPVIFTSILGEFSEYYISKNLVLYVNGLVIFLISVFFSLFMFYVLKNKIKIKKNRYLLGYWFELKRIFIDNEVICSRIHSMREHASLTDWQVLELKVRLQRAENALMEAREVLKRYQPPTEKSANPLS
jgi:hypothetical protein